MKDSITVIYIISDRRSGSTLLENILSKSVETVSVGELAMLKGHIEKEGPGNLWNWNCSCGKAIMQCEFWSKVLANIYDKKFETKINWPYKSMKAIYASLFPSRGKKVLPGLVQLKENIDTAEKLDASYLTIATVSGKKIIIDSSKDPIQALTLNTCKNIKAKFIWLSRDLRAITFSKLKHWYINKRSDKKPLETLTDSLFYKRVCQAVCKSFNKKNVIHINYEMLAVNPQKELDKICKKFGLQTFEAPKYLELLNNHTIAGTPGRFERKPITIDNSWEDFFKAHLLLNFLGKVFNAL